MEVSVKDWLSLAETHTPLEDKISTSFHDIKTMESDAHSLCALMSEAVILPNKAGKELVYLRSAQGAQLAIKCARQVLDDMSVLPEFEQDFKEQFVVKLVRRWQTEVLKHFLSHPLSEEEQQQAQKSHLPFDIATFADHPEVLLNLYDASLTAVLLHENQLLMIQIGRSDIYLLTEGNQIEHIQNQVSFKSSKHLQPLLASPIAHRRWVCKTHDLEHQAIELVMLASSRYRQHQADEKHKTNLYKFVRQLDTEGSSATHPALKEHLQQVDEPNYSTSLVLIKRKRQWHDGLSRAFGREVFRLEDTVTQQNHHIESLQQELHQLRKSVDHVHPLPPQLLREQKVDQKTKPRHGLKLLVVISLTMLSAIAFGFYQTTFKQTDTISVAATIPLVIPEAKEPTYKPTVEPLSLTTLSPKKPANSPLLDHVFQQSIVQVDNIEQCNILQLDKPIEKNNKLNLAAKPEDKQLQAKKERELVEKEQTKKKQAQEAKRRQQAALAKKEAQRKQAQAALEKEQAALQREKKRVLVEKLVLSSANFGNTQLLLSKRQHDLKIINELIDTTGEPYYFSQQQNLTKNIHQIKTKLKKASQQYRTGLRQLCALNKKNNLPRLQQQTKMERFAFNQLNHHLSFCQNTNRLSQRNVHHALVQSYQTIMKQNN